MSELNQKKSVPLWIQIVVWIFLAGLLVLVASILSKRQQGTLNIGDKVPNFSMTLFSGYEFENKSEINFTDFSGKIVVINFWASWCKPCEQEAAELEATWKFYQPTGNVIFLGVDYVDTEPEARIFLKKFGITYLNGPDIGTKVSQLFRIAGVPETFFVDQQGVVYYVKIGPFISVDEIKSIIEQKLK